MLEKITLTAFEATHLAMTPKKLRLERRSAGILTEFGHLLLT